MCTAQTKKKKKKNPKVYYTYNNYAVHHLVLL